MLQLISYAARLDIITDKIYAGSINMHTHHQQAYIGYITFVLLVNWTFSYVLPQPFPFHIDHIFRS